MFSPFIPHITESIYQSFYKDEKSVHLSSWPKLEKSLENEEVVRNLFEIISLIRGQKSKDGKNLATQIENLTIISKQNLKLFNDHLLAVSRANNLNLSTSDENSIKIDYTN